MDTVTQIALGAAVGEAVAGRETGNTAPAWGAFFGLLPDLDVLANPFLTETQALVFHRSLTHSLLFAAVVSVCAAIGLRRFHRKSSASTARWMSLVAAVLLTHVGLDCLTTYGTQIFWPFSRTPVLLGTIFVIDPLYTLSLGTGLLAALWWSPADRIRRRLNAAGLILSSAYLLLTVVNKRHVNRVFEQAMSEQVGAYERVLTRPTPFNNLLWQGIAEVEDGYYVGLYSLLDDDRTLDFHYVPKRHDLLGAAARSPEVKRLRRFSRGYFAVERSPHGSLLLHDLRFGRSDLGLTHGREYLFSFRLVQDPTGTVLGVIREEPNISLDRPLLRRFFARIRGKPVEPPVSTGRLDATSR